MGKIEKQTGKIENHTGKIRRGKKLKIRGEKLKMIWGKLKIKGVKYPNINFFFFWEQKYSFFCITPDTRKPKLEHEKEKYDGKYTYVMVN